MSFRPVRVIALLCAALVIGCGIAACGGDDDAPVDDPLTPVGLTVDAAGELAESQGLQWRVVEEDGEPRALTMDFIPERLNFIVSEGVVIAAVTDDELTEN